MPDWENYYFSYDAAGTSGHVYQSTATQIQQSYENYCQALEQQNDMIEQMWREEEQRREDKINYPLFFLKEGIV